MRKLYGKYSHRLVNGLMVIAFVALLFVHGEAPRSLLLGFIVGAGIIQLGVVIARRRRVKENVTGEKNN